MRCNAKYRRNVYAWLNIEEKKQDKVFVTDKKKPAKKKLITTFKQTETNTSSKCALERFCVVQAFHKNKTINNNTLSHKSASNDQFGLPHASFDPRYFRKTSAHFYVFY